MSARKMAVRQTDRAVDITSVSLVAGRSQLS
jgi:hypothetical protein